MLDTEEIILKVHLGKREVELCKRMLIEIIASVAIVLSIIIAVCWYFFKPICPSVDWRINRTTGFELFATQGSNDRMGGYPKALLANSQNMTSPQLSLVYDYISKAKRIERAKPINWFLQSSNGAFIKIEFDNGVVMYFEDRSNTYLDKNNLNCCRLAVDSDFSKYISDIFKNMSEYMDISIGIYVNQISSVLSPHDLYRLKNGTSKAVEWDESEALKLPQIEYDKKPIFNGEHTLNYIQLQRIEEILIALGKAGITYEFDNSNEILADDLLMYAGLRSRFFYDIMVDSKERTKLIQSQVAVILEGDFERDSRFILSDSMLVLNTKWEFGKIDIVSIHQNEYDVTVTANVYDDFKDEKTFHKMDYSFSVDKYYGEVRLLKSIRVGE